MTGTDDPWVPDGGSPAGDATVPTPAVAIQLASALTRIAALEQRVAVLEGSAAITPPTPPPPVQPVTVGIAPPPDPMPEPAPPAAPARTSVPVSGERFLRWSGATLVFLAGVFLVSTAVSRGWIGPTVQWCGALLLGAGLVATSVRLSVRRPRWALALGMAGVGVLFATDVAGTERLDLYGPAVAAILAVAVAIVGWFQADRLGRASLAGVTFVAFAASVFEVVGARQNPMAVGSLLAAAILASGVLGQARSWASLRVLTFGVGIPLVAAWIDIVDAGWSGVMTSRDALSAVLIGLLFGGFWFLTTVNARRTSTADGWVFDSMAGIEQSLERLLLVAAPFLSFMTVGLWLSHGTDDGVGRLALVTSLVWMGLTAVSHLMGARITHTVGLGVGATSVFALAIGILTGTHTTLVALGVQALGAGWVALRTKDSLARLNAVLLTAIVGLWAGDWLAGAVEFEASSRTLVVLAVTVVLFAAGAVMTRHLSTPDTLERRIAHGLAMCVLVGGLAWIAAALGHLPQGQVAVSIIWAVVGAALLLGALRTDRNMLGRIGLGVLGVTVVKLVTIDLEAVDSLWRAALFGVVGLGLVRLGMLLADDGDGDTKAPTSSGGAAVLPPDGGEGRAVGPNTEPVVAVERPAAG